MIFLKKSQKSTAMQHWQLQQGFPGKQFLGKLIKIENNFNSARAVAFALFLDSTLVESYFSDDARNTNLDPSPDSPKSPMEAFFFKFKKKRKKKIADIMITNFHFKYTWGVFTIALTLKADFGKLFAVSAVKLIIIIIITGRFQPGSA